MDTYNDYRAWIRRLQWVMLQDQSDEDRMHYNQNKVASESHPYPWRTTVGTRYEKAKTAVR